MEEKNWRKFISGSIYQELIDRKCTPKTAKTYTSVLVKVLLGTTQTRENKLHRELFDDVGINLDFVTSLQEPSTRSICCAALLKITGLEPYKEHLLVERAILNARSEKQETLKSRSNLSGATKNDMAHVHESSLESYNRLRECGSITRKCLIDAIITGIYSGFYKELPPRRLADWADVRVHYHDGGNYYDIDKQTVTFNQHKTTAKGGQAVVLDIPVELQPLFKLRSIADEEFLLVTERGNKFTSPSLNSRLNELFGFSVDVMRSVIISNQNEGVPALSDMINLAVKMGHSVNTQLVHYTKKS